MNKEHFKGIHDLDVYLYTDEDGKIVRRKTWYFYLLPIWVKQYKI